ncbi:restriction endonuclease subunit S [Streptococcus sp. 27098_8_75]|uniref:restriction endonuclease subunit S n=1 Tax=Streptococcus TaxID=1301 RepID=UPI0022843EF9|nr:restriction endonuclease subunit S [Streptococcus gordonii]MCY7144632.1 restriction endonuclease subunit S [Streptococcus gordonii]
MKAILPKIKFKNFYEKWNRKKLQSIAPLRGGFAFKSEKFQNVGIPIVRISNIGFDGTVGGEFEYYSKLSPDEKFVLKGRSLLLAMSGATTGKIAMLDSEEEYYQNQRVGYFQNNGAVDYDFLSSVLQTKAFTNQLNAVLVAGAQPNISSKEIDSFEFCIPESIEEQSAIGSLFRTLDDLLASYKDNLANYQSHKANMLSKMFPKAGQTVPEIRLDGFEGEWKKSKLKDVAHRVQGNDGRMDLPTLTISASGGWMNQIDRFSANIAGKEQKNYTLLKKGELSYNHGNSKLAKYGVVFELQDYEEALVPKVYHSFRVNQLANAKFIEIMFSTKIPDRELGKLVSSGARMDGLLNISFEDFMNIAIIIPTIEEQQAIGTYFSNLDNLITAHQEKISQLEILKKKLLQDMFI